MSKLYHQTMDALEKGLTCRLIATELEEGPDETGDKPRHDGVRPESTTDDELVTIACERGYSHLFLCKEMPDLDPPWWLTKVACIDRKERCCTERREIRSDDVLSADTPVADCIHLLGRRPFYLVLERDRLRYVVTPADLNRLPVRTYLLTLLAHLEGMLAEVIDKVLPGDSWLGRLSEKRREEVRKLHDQKKQQDFDTCMIDCTFLSDKTKIIRDFAQKMGADSKGQVDGEGQYIQRLRNRLAHNLNPLSLCDENGTMRDHLHHGQPLTNEKQLAWLCEAEGLMRRWIRALAASTATGEIEKTA
jgi:hypothetical protein